MREPKVAIIHDYLRTYGGGERVLEVLHEIWPKAPIFIASANFKKLGIFADKFRKMNLIFSWIQDVPIIGAYPLLYRPLLPLIWSSFKVDDFDIIISSSGSNMAKNISTSKTMLHICYCHTPPRFLYGFETENKLFQKIGFLLKPLLLLYQQYDQSCSKNVDYFIANSKTIARRIRKIYHRDAIVINPPVILTPLLIRKSLKSNYYLVVSRLVAHKHVDVIIKTANILKLPLIIIGNGPELKYLKNLAGPTIFFLGEIDDKKLSVHYRNCKALLIASRDEDFGLTAIEANYFGAPIIAYASGGLTETVHDGKNGYLYTELSEKSLMGAIQKIERRPIDRLKCVNASKNYNKEKFKERIKKYVYQKWKDFEMES